jgi:hypothetical protein
VQRPAVEYGVFSGRAAVSQHQTRSLRALKSHIRIHLFLYEINTQFRKNYGLTVGVAVSVLALGVSINSGVAVAAATGGVSKKPRIFCSPLTGANTILPLFTRA